MLLKKPNTENSDKHKTEGLFIAIPGEKISNPEQYGLQYTNIQTHFREM